MLSQRSAGSLRLMESLHWHLDKHGQQQFFPNCLFVHLQWCISNQDETEGPMADRTWRQIITVVQIVQETYIL